MQSTPKGMLMAKQALQLNASIRAPPIMGAVTRPMDEQALTRLMAMGSFETGKQCLMSFRPPPWMALVPTPAIDLPKMNMWELWEKVQSKDPSSKTAIPNTNRGLMEYKVYIFPKLSNHVSK